MFDFFITWGAILAFIAALALGNVIIGVLANFFKNSSLTLLSLISIFTSAFISIIAGTGFFAKFEPEHYVYGDFVNGHLVISEVSHSIHYSEVYDRRVFVEALSGYLLFRDYMENDPANDPATQDLDNCFGLRVREINPRGFGAVHRHRFLEIHETYFDDLRDAYIACFTETGQNFKPFGDIFGVYNLQSRSLTEATSMIASELVPFSEPSEAEQSTPEYFFTQLMQYKLTGTGWISLGFFFLLTTLITSAISRKITKG